MIPRECKRLAEVDFPIAAVSQYAVSEKAIRHGMPSALHVWWARRPLASSRAMLMALLLPDPCDAFCPIRFKNEARRILLSMPGRIRGWTEKVKTDDGLRRVVLDFIAEFANWNNAHNEVYLNTGRALVKAAYGAQPPVVVDPFAGSGSIPLEALRVGCDSVASDLNPVACLILKVMLENIPRSGPTLTDQILEIGQEIKEKAEPKLSSLYPKHHDGSTPIAYLWARTVRCEGSGCGAEIPLLRSLWLCNKKSRPKALRVTVVRPKDEPPHINFEIFEPKKAGEVQSGTIIGARARCPCCPAVLAPERVCSQLAEQRGGADVIFDDQGRRIGGARMTAVVVLKPGERGRDYRPPTRADYAAVRRGQSRLKELLDEWELSRTEGLRPVPDELMPPIGTLGFRVQKYGMLQWEDLFTARQKVALSVLAEEISATKESLRDPSLLALGKLIDLGNGLCGWMPGQECPSAVFKLGRVKMSWDFVESCPMSESSGSFAKCVGNLAAGVRATNVPGAATGQTMQAMAQASPLPDGSASVYFTDPPYYDAKPYADLADAFLVWMKRADHANLFLPDPFDPQNPLSPKDQEAVQDNTKSVEGRPKDAAFFDQTMGVAFAEGRRILQEDGVGGVVFAHKSTEGWEAFLSGMIRGGWTITGSWPIVTEMGHRLRARDSAALATSVHLVCRPRLDDAPTGDWADVLRELPTRVGEWMKRLECEGVRGADLVFACVGPALEIFSRYSRVETAAGEEVGLPVYLERVWEVVGRTALENVLGTEEARARNGQAGVLEEDARLTALFLWTVKSSDHTQRNGSARGADEEAGTKGSVNRFSLPFDVVRRFAQPMGINLEKWTDRIVEQKKGVVRLLPVTSRAKTLFGHHGAQAAADWIESDPTTSVQQALFPEFDQPPPPAGPGRGNKSIIDENAELQSLNATALDRLHAAMLLQNSGHSNALRRLIVAEQDRGPEFLRLANALSALYPRGSDEKRLLDGMLLAVPR